MKKRIIALMFFYQCKTHISSLYFYLHKALMGVMTQHCWLET